MIQNHGLGTFRQIQIILNGSIVLGENLFLLSAELLFIMQEKADTRLMGLKLLSNREVRLMI
ncbi:hypothetical protein ABH20_11075 [Geobacillus sp. T6]|nr:hypothetical protein GT3921_08815 [Geobacillus thermocatenulatus]KLR73423.1 hypothetical protein ABH20_11075 [Geobacillus sp. T6]